MMVSKMTQQKQQGFLKKYRKWIIGAAGIYLIPTILVLAGVIGGFIYTYINDDVHSHPYKSYIMSGFYAGHADGAKDYVSGKRPASSLWDNYWWETKRLKEKVALEKEEYLAQFPESERGIKLAEMRTQNIRLPLQLELDKRFTRGIDFYADYVKQRVKRKSFKSDKEYKEALKNEAWKVGYAHGYREGLAGIAYDTAISGLY